MAGLHPRGTGRHLGGLALPPGRLEEPPPRRRHHGHAHLARRAGRVRLVGRWRCSSATPASRDDHGRHRRRRAAETSTSRSPPRSPCSCWPGGTSRPRPSAGPGRRCGPCSSSAPRTSRCCATATRCGSRSSSSRRATASSSGPGEKIATDGVVVEGSSAVDALDGHRGERARGGGARRCRDRCHGERRRPPRRARHAGRGRHGAGPDGQARAGTPSRARLPCSGWPTASRRCSCPSSSSSPSPRSASGSP